MKQRSPHHGFGEIQAPASVRIKLEFKSLQPAVHTKACRKAGQIRVPFAGQSHVQCARQANPNRTFRLPCTQGRDGRPVMRLDFFASECPAHT